MFRFSPPLQHHLVSKFRKECSSFEALPDAAGDVDQLRWWQAHQEQFPLLSYLVRVVFVVPQNMCFLLLATEELLGTAAVVNVSISKYLIYCRGIIVSFL